MKVHLVDGTYELFRAFYAVPSMTAPDGREVGATRQIMRTLAGLLSEPEVTHVAVAFDHVIESFRNDLFAGYKTGEGIDPYLRSQFELAEDACRAMGLVTWAMVEVEADDALATAAAGLAERGDVEQIVVCSPDKDLAQCVRGDRVVCLDRMRRTVLDEDGVRAKFGVSPGSIPDWLALVGDTADGIPGIERWGPKSAATVLARYGQIEAIPDDAGAWDVKVRGASALAQRLAARRADALLYRRLATLRLDADVDWSPEHLRWRGADERAYQAFVRERLGSERLLDALPPVK